jgi:hypothetical protein
MRTESIFKSNNDKDTIELLRKKHKLDRSLQHALNKASKPASFSDTLSLNPFKTKIIPVKKN